MPTTTLITGASGGLGRDFAHKFAEVGSDLVLVARSREKLDQLAQELSTQHGIQAHVLVHDLGIDDAAQDLVDELSAANLQVDVLVNNAGYATYGLFQELDLETELKMIRLNILTLTHLTGLLLPRMLARGQGKILNIGSTASFQPGPLMAVYYATKAYVLSFSEALAEELRDQGVTVTALCPGPTATGFQERAAMTESRLMQSGLMESRRVVEIGYAGLMQGKAVVVPGPRNKLGAWLVRLMPRGMTTRLVRRIQQRVSH